jgi:hypothetical protein
MAVCPVGACSSNNNNSNSSSRLRTQQQLRRQRRLQVWVVVVVVDEGILAPIEVLSTPLLRWEELLSS